ncbi:hypothetical protein [Bradyrhizobium sp. Leo121]|uniref:hypothetical protein n=1 Tax=Bradyrhizobium sp. Leo121 TaxID=1571195 RepID=UPI00102A15A3|nr:hypothetical protein [Bradyrhizobium sp. Leo121]
MFAAIEAAIGDGSKASVSYVAFRLDHDTARPAVSRSPKLLDRLGMIAISPGRIWSMRSGSRTAGGFRQPWQLNPPGAGVWVRGLFNDFHVKEIAMTKASTTPPNVTKASTTSPIVTNAERHSRLAYSLFFPRYCCVVCM